ncbi:MAG: tetratricopeptide repeat protein [Candidatus Hodarchaeota archaeon]
MVYNKSFFKKKKEKIKDKTKKSERKISTELSFAQQLIKECNFNDALKLVNNLEELNTLTPEEQLSIHVLKSSLLVELQNYGDALNYSEQAFRESQELKDNLYLFDTYINQIQILIDFREFQNAFDLILKSEDLLKDISEEMKIDPTNRKANLFWVKAHYFNVCIGDLNQSFKLFNQALKLAKEINNKYLICKSLNSIGVLFALKGELDLSIRYYELSLNAAKEINYKRRILGTLSNIGEIYYLKGDLNRALDYIKQSLIFSEEMDITFTTSMILSTSIDLTLAIGDFNSAGLYLERLKRIYDKEKTVSIDSIYRYSKAIILKASKSARNRGKAEEMLKYLISEDILEYQLKVGALLNLCDILLIELSNSSDIEILGEIQTYILQLSNYAKENSSYSLLAETYLLQARLALLILDLDTARKFLTQSQQIAEKYGLNLLARKISSEHDELLKQLSFWDKLKESKASLSERMKFARLNEQMEGMLKKRAIEIPDLTEETPVLLLVVTEGGNPVFSQSFEEDQSFEDPLLGGFFTAINSFINEKFSEGLDRAIFGEHTLLMKSVSPFLMCYVYKGQSYLAQQRINYFIDEIKNSQLIWETFEKSYRSNKEIQLKDISSLEPLIREIFIDRTKYLINNILNI